MRTDKAASHTWITRTGSRLHKCEAQGKVNMCKCCMRGHAPLCSRVTTPRQVFTSSGLRIERKRWFIIIKLRPVGAPVHKGGISWLTHQLFTVTFGFMRLIGRWVLVIVRVVSAQHRRMNQQLFWVVGIGRHGPPTGLTIKPKKSGLRPCFQTQISLGSMERL